MFLLIILIGYLFGIEMIGLLIIGAFVSGLGLAVASSNACAILTNLSDYASGNSIKNV